MKTTKFSDILRSYGTVRICWIHFLNWFGLKSNPKGKLIKEYTMTLPEALSPCNNVRRTCEMKMKDPLTVSLLSSQEDGNGKRTVEIDLSNLSKMATQIFQSMSDPHQKDQDFVEWDEYGWHYTGENYNRPHSNMSDEKIKTMRNERVALYVLALDAMNFCFWPAHTNSKGDAVDADSALEYHHLATALKHAAELDDIIDKSKADSSSISNKEIVQSESSYRLSPDSLSQITPDELQSLLSPHLPLTEENNPTILPSLVERCRLLNELGWGLRQFYSSSALALLQKANESADTLVSLLVSSFSGFRDEVVDHAGRLIYFYKRAQIAVGDLKAALGTPAKQHSAKATTQSRAYCNLADFKDMDKLTTFPDYRVPQFLRHEGVLRYAPELGEHRIDKLVELRAGEEDEIYIRAATVVAVEMLVKEVNSLLERSEKEEVRDIRDKNKVEYLNAVKIDWYLWQLGEKLENERKMSFHHRTRTIYY